MFCHSAGSTCLDGQWPCLEGLPLCIHREWICDGENDCRDGSDEDHTMCSQTTCPPGNWKCQDGVQCIEESELCFGPPYGLDCRDGSDEDPEMCANRTCPAGYWQCQDGPRCIEESKVCDNFENCYDRMSDIGPLTGSDEDPATCAQWKCPVGLWKCQDILMRCIKEVDVCDGRKSCKDGSDEDPDTCFQWNCIAGDWKCQDGLLCIEDSKVCERDRWTTCADESDEDPLMCNTQGTCTHGYRKCEEDQRCRPEHLMCDGKIHCSQSSDEDPATCAQWNCSAGHWRCADGLQCIPNNWVCDGDLQSGHTCRDQSDEDPAMCAQWNCSAWLGLTMECADELGCGVLKCADNLQCVHRKSICDGRFDCKDRSDELCNDGCLIKPLEPEEKGIVKKCPEDISRCVSIKQYCDGIGQCPDASDETHQGCTCEDWGLKSCVIHQNQPQMYCINKNWSPSNTLKQSSFKDVNCQDFLHEVKTPMTLKENDTGL